jgi:hypothetical protein
MAQSTYSILGKINDALSHTCPRFARATCPRANRREQKHAGDDAKKAEGQLHRLNLRNYDRICHIFSFFLASFADPSPRDMFENTGANKQRCE